VDKNVPNDIGFNLTLSTRTPYAQMVTAVAKHLNVDSGFLQFFKAQTYRDAPGLDFTNSRFRPKSFQPNYVAEQRAKFLPKITDKIGTFLTFLVETMAQRSSKNIISDPLFVLSVKYT
jgi:hypothetical protein